MGDAPKLTDDQKTFLGYAELSKMQFDLDSDAGHRDFSTNYERWVAQGRPTPKLESPKEESPIPFKIYREKVRGEEKMYWRDTKNGMHGKTVTKVDEQRTGADGQPYTRPVEKVSYDLPYSKVEAEKLIDDAEKRANNPQYYLVHRTRKVSVTAKQFTLDFDAMLGPSNKEVLAGARR